LQTTSKRSSSKKYNSFNEINKVKNDEEETDYLNLEDSTSTLNRLSTSSQHRSRRTLIVNTDLRLRKNNSFNNLSNSGINNINNNNSSNNNNNHYYYYHHHHHHHHHSIEVEENKSFLKKTDLADDDLNDDYDNISSYSQSLLTDAVTMNNRKYSNKISENIFDNLYNQGKGLDF